MQKFQDFLNEAVAESTGEVLSAIGKQLEKDYGFVVKDVKSTLGGPDKTSYALKVFGPKSGWSNNIAQNSPVKFTIWHHGGDKHVEMQGIGSEMQKAGVKKLRKTRFKDADDLDKKLKAYFKKNSAGLSSFAE